MEILFNEIIARSYDRWAETPLGRQAYGLEEKLLLRLGKLAAGQKVLQAGCGTGTHLEIFLREGLNALGLDVSFDMLRLAKKKLGKNVPLCLGDGEILPFKEQSFDCVAFITTLEFVRTPTKAIQEAFRVSRGEVLLGVLNRLSILGISRRLLGRFRPSIYNCAQFYTIWELRRLVAKAVPGATVDWASVLVLPLGWPSRLPGLERWLSFRRNPLGAFLGLRVSIKER